MAKESEHSNSNNPPRHKNVLIGRIKIIAYSALFLTMLLFIIAIFIAKVFF